MKIFETFRCSCQILSNSLCQSWNINSIPLESLYLSSVSWKIIPLYFFSSNNVYFPQTELIKMKIFETFEWSGQILSKSLCQYLNKTRLSAKFCIPLQFHERLLLCTFLAQAIYTLLKRSSLKSTFLDFPLLLGSYFVKFLMPILKKQLDNSPNLVPLFSFMKDYCSVLF